MQTVIKVTCVDQALQLTSTPAIACGGSNEVRVEFSFCPLWQGYTRTAMFWRDHKEVHTVPLDDADTCLVPDAVLQTDGVLYFAVYGLNADGVRRTSEMLAYPIGVGAITEGTQPPEPSPDLYVQVLAAVANAQPSTSILPVTEELLDSDSVPVYSASAAQHRRITWGSLVAKLCARLFGTANGVLQADGKGNVSAKSVDSTPTKDSTNLVTSGGVQAALAATVKPVDSTPTEGSTNLVTSGGVQKAIADAAVKPSDLWSCGTDDMVDGESPLEEGKLYFVI